MANDNKLVNLADLKEAFDNIPTANIIKKITLANIAFIGMNPTGGTSNDTREWWTNKGTCYAFIAGANQVNGQPADYGFIVNIVYASDVYQMWLTAPGGARYHRGGNNSTSVMPGWTVDTNIITTTVTDTPDSNGNINLGLSEYDCVVAAVKGPSLIATPWVNYSNHSWHARITNIIDGGAITSGNVTVTVYYQAL